MQLVVPTSCRKLGHILNSLDITGELLFVVDLIREMADYSHYVISKTPSNAYDYDTIWLLQSIGANVLITDNITVDKLSQIKLSGVIFHNTINMPGLGKVIPSIYYSYGNYDPTCGCKVIVAASGLGITSDGSSLPDSYVISPGINTRALRYHPKKPGPFTVGVITTGAYGKYPCDVVMTLLPQLPNDINIVITELPFYKHPGVPLALESISDKSNLIRCPLKITAGLYYIARCDVILYATAKAYTEIYSRTVVEAMAFGRPVICERKGCFPILFEDKVNTLMFSTTDEAAEHIQRLQKDERCRTSLALNAQLRASWEDISIHAGDIRNVLRSIGV